MSGPASIIGAEALARWLHPDGVRSAGVFFEAVEELGLVDELTDPACSSS